MKSVFFTPAAVMDLREIRDYVASERPDAADRLLMQLHERIDVLRAAPKAGRARSDLASGIRMFVVSPYVVLYRVDGSTIRISRVVHGARDFYEVLGGELEE